MYMYIPELQALGLVGSSLDVYHYSNNKELQHNKKNNSKYMTFAGPGSHRSSGSGTGRRSVPSSLASDF